VESETETPEAVRPKFKHVQPSGRGMQSEHELAAKRAAVAAIEKRFEHDEKARRRAARKRALSRFLSILAGLAFLAGMAWFFTHRAECMAGLRKLASARSLGDLGRAVGVMVPDASQTVEVPVVDSVARDRFAAVAKAFAVGDLAYWREAPASLRPKNAPAGTVYHALVPQDGAFGLYELKTGGDVAELSPFAPPLPMTTADFKKQCGGKPYFLACGGRVFVCGGGDLKKMDELRKALLPR